MYLKFNGLSFKILGAVVAIVLICMITISFNISETIQVATGKKLKPIYKVDTKEKKVAISFDACWGSENTLKILDILDKYNVKTTFFLVNIWLEDYPDKAKEIRARGHEIGLHSTTHPHFTRLSDEKIREELQKNKDMIKKVTGFDAILFRPPFGDYDSRVVKIIQDMGLYPIQWSVDSLDWRGLSASQMTRRVTERIGPGDIVLFHNDGEHTVEAIDEIIKILQSQGYKIVPVSELIYKGDYYVDVNGIQHGK